MASSKTNDWLLTGLILGAVGGGVAAVLITRNKRKKILDETWEYSGKVMNQARTKGEKQILKARETADRLLSNADEILKLSRKYAQGDFDNDKEEYKRQLDELRKKINDI